MYESYSRDVYRFALYLSGDPALADDITSETFIRVWSSTEPVRRATVKAYLLTIARNLWLMERRLVGYEGLDDAIPGSKQSVLLQVEIKDELDRVLRASQKMPEVDRTALLMRVDEGLPYEDIAAALGVPVAHALAPVYLSGEASADTIALVEEFLRLDSDLARAVEGLRDNPLPEVPIALRPTPRKGDVRHDETNAVVARNFDGLRKLPDHGPPVVSVP
jgi:RNA polymerase sigma-70 factor (ECF subfamily)